MVPIRPEEQVIHRIVKSAVLLLSTHEACEGASGCHGPGLRHELRDVAGAVASRSQGIHAYEPLAATRKTSVTTTSAATW